MAANTQSQHRCVFVGNIPYDATEEQLVQICEEVGPVVSFRLVIDRETGKPKGYGFCEYKDEETALSARRNLQGYEINGRQLRVDFAENDKNADRNRELGRGGPGVATNVDAQKQFGGPAGLGLPNLHQPIGDSVAMTAATVMAGALGSAQVSSTSNQIGLQNPSLFGADPLTRHLGRMSRGQLTEVVSELKAMATQNKEQARQLLLAIPNLRKALFQAQIMLGIVSPQMLQMSNIHQASSAQSMLPLVQNAQILPGLPPLPHNNTQSVQNLPTQAQIQLPQLTQGQLLSQLVVPSRPSIHPQSVGQQIQTTTSSSFNQQMQHPFSQNVAPTPPTTSGHIMAQNSSGRASMLVHPKFSAAGFQLSSSSPSGMPEHMDLEGAHPLDRASKKVKLNDERANPSPQAVSITTVAMSAPFSTRGLPGKQVSGNEAALSSEKQATQVQLPPGIDAALLQQVLSLTPEQLSCLPPDQQQQVIQLQQTLRQAL